MMRPIAGHAQGAELFLCHPRGHDAGLRPAVDLHCHILPGIDDGARDVGDAVAMAQQAEADGIAAICATPHIRHDHDVRITELPVRLAELRCASKARGCRTEILPGGEVAVTALDLLDEHELRAVTLGGAGRWVLLEPAPGPLDRALDSAVERLQTRGFRALIAHPERHLSRDLAQRLARLVRAGALIQVTAAFLTDERSREGMLALAREHVVHVLGSDSHSAHAGRPVALAPALGVLRTVESLAPHIEWIACTAPQAIASGKEVTPPF